LTTENGAFSGNHFRKEAKELLVQEAKAADPANPNLPMPGRAAGARGLAAGIGLAGGRLAGFATGEAIIGRGCCVQLSVEYMPANVSLNDQTCNVNNSRKATT